MQYRVHVIRQGSMEVPTRTIGTVHRLRHPTTLKELQSFLEVSRLFLYFVLYSAHVSAPLNRILQKGQLQILTDFPTKKSQHWRR